MDDRAHDAPPHTAASVARGRGARSRGGGGGDGGGGVAPLLFSRSTPPPAAAAGTAAAVEIGRAHV